MKKHRLVLIAGSLYLFATGCASVSSSELAEVPEPYEPAAADMDYDDYESDSVVSRFDMVGDVPFVPTPEAVVEVMLQVGQVSKDDLVYDLGSGDGRIPILAAQKFGARAVGIDINPDLVELAKDKARLAGVQRNVNFYNQDLFDTDLSEATVVTLYLLPDVNIRLRPKLFRELRPGTRVISHDFDMGEWEPEEVIEVRGRTVYKWTIPEQVPEHLLR